MRARNRTVVSLGRFARCEFARDPALEQDAVASWGGNHLEQFGETKAGTRARSERSFARWRAGRIVEVRVGRLARLADVQSLNASVFAAVARGGPGAVICADFREATPFGGEIANVWSQGMRRANEYIARSALLLDPSNTMFNLQLERVVRCAGNEHRRLFSHADELCEWLDAALTHAEREALRTLFSPADGLRAPAPG